jgi:hypothetical protein
VDAAIPLPTGFVVFLANRALFVRTASSAVPGTGENPYSGASEEIQSDFFNRFPEEWRLQKEAAENRLAQDRRRCSSDAAEC